MKRTRLRCAMPGKQRMEVLRMALRARRATKLLSC